MSKNNRATINDRKKGTKEPLNKLVDTTINNAICPDKPKLKRQTYYLSELQINYLKTMAYHNGYIGISEMLQQIIEESMKNHPELKKEAERMMSKTKNK